MAFAAAAEWQVCKVASSFWKGRKAGPPSTSAKRVETLVILEHQTRNTAFYLKPVHPIYCYFPSSVTG